jgi:hypothetical protein
MVHVTETPDEVPSKLKENVTFLDEAYPEIDIEFLVEEGTFTPELVAKLSKKWRIPTNFMFVGCPGNGLGHNLAELGGIRVII